MQQRPASQQTMGAVYGVPTDGRQRAKKTIVFYPQRLHTTSCLNGTFLQREKGPIYEHVFFLHPAENLVSRPGKRWALRQH
jgi:hypothetical protein